MIIQTPQKPNYPHQTNESYQQMKNIPYVNACIAAQWINYLQHFQVPPQNLSEYNTTFTQKLLKISNQIKRKYSIQRNLQIQKLVTQSVKNSAQHKIKDHKKRYFTTQQFQFLPTTITCSIFKRIMNRDQFGIMGTDRIFKSTSLVFFIEVNNFIVNFAMISSAEQIEYFKRENHIEKIIKYFYLEISKYYLIDLNREGAIFKKLLYQAKEITLIQKYSDKQSLLQCNISQSFQIIKDRYKQKGVDVGLILDELNQLNNKINNYFYHNDQIQIIQKRKLLNKPNYQLRQDDQQFYTNNYQMTQIKQQLRVWSKVYQTFKENDSHVTFCCSIQIQKYQFTKYKHQVDNNFTINIDDRSFLYSLKYTQYQFLPWNLMEKYHIFWFAIKNIIQVKYYNKDSYGQQDYNQVVNYYHQVYLHHFEFIGPDPISTIQNNMKHYLCIANKKPADIMQMCSRNCNVQHINFISEKQKQAFISYLQSPKCYKSIYWQSEKPNMIYQHYYRYGSDDRVQVLYAYEHIASETYKFISSQNTIQQLVNNCQTLENIQQFVIPIKLESLNFISFQHFNLDDNFYNYRLGKMNISPFYFIEMIKILYQHVLHVKTKHQQRKLYKQYDQICLQNINYINRTYQKVLQMALRQKLLVVLTNVRFFNKTLITEFQWQLQKQNQILSHIQQSDNQQCSEMKGTINFLMFIENNQNDIGNIIRQGVKQSKDNVRKLISDSFSKRSNQLQTNCNQVPLVEVFILTLCLKCQFRKYLQRLKQVMSAIKSVLQQEQNKNKIQLKLKCIIIGQQHCYNEIRQYYALQRYSNDIDVGFCSINDFHFKAKQSVKLMGMQLYLKAAINKIINKYLTQKSEMEIQQDENIEEQDNSYQSQVEQFSFDGLNSDSCDSQ